MTREAYAKDRGKKHNIFEDVAIEAYSDYTTKLALQISSGVFVSEQHEKVASAKLDVARNYLKELRA